MGGDSLEGGTAVTGAEEEWLGLTCFLWRALQFWNHTWGRRKAMQLCHVSAECITSSVQQGSNFILPYKHSVNLNKLFLKKKKSSVDKRETFCIVINGHFLFPSNISVLAYLKNWFYTKPICSKIKTGERTQESQKSFLVLPLAFGTERKTEKALSIRIFLKKYTTKCTLRHLLDLF